MKKSQKPASRENNSYKDPMFIPILLSQTSNPGEVRLDAEEPDTGFISVNELKEQWGFIVSSIKDIILGEASSNKEGFSVDEVHFSLALNAKGKLAWLAEAGGEGAIEVVLRRSKS